MASADDSLYPIAVLIDELRNEDVQVSMLTAVYECLISLRCERRVIKSFELMRKLLLRCRHCVSASGFIAGRKYFIVVSAGLQHLTQQNVR